MTKLALAPVAAPAPVNHDAAARAALASLAAELRARFIGRDEVIDATMVAAVAGLNAVQLGAPGTAKTALATAFSRGLGVSDSEHFAALLTRFTTPEELFGPVSFSSLKADRFERVTDGYLPAVRTAFLDECFKASPAILNALLTLLNERRFRNGASWSACPLAFVLAASNEYPEGAHLAALWDRFTVRFWIEYAATPADRAAIRRAKGDRGMPVCASLSDLEAARAGAAAVSVPVELDGAFQSIVEAVEKSTGVPVSDRKLVQCERLARAAAWIRGSAVAERCDFWPLAHALWEHHDQRDAVRAAVDRVAASALGDARRIEAALRKLLGAVPVHGSDAAAFERSQRDAVLAQIVATGDEVKRGIARLSTLRDGASEPEAIAIDAMIGDMNTQLKSLRAVYSEIAFG